MQLSVRNDIYHYVRRVMFISVKIYMYNKWLVSTDSHIEYTDLCRNQLLDHYTALYMYYTNVILRIVLDRNIFIISINTKTLELFCR